MKELETRATEAASTFLRRRGYAVLETGWESEAGTADIVAEDGDALVSVRVQVRLGAGSAFPAGGGASERTEREGVALVYLAEYIKLFRLLRGMGPAELARRKVNSPPPCRSA